MYQAIDYYTGKAWAKTGPCKTVEEAWKQIREVLRIKIRDGEIFNILFFIKEI